MASTRPGRRCCRICAYGFDADPQECARLTDEHDSPQVRFVPLALGAAPGRAELHVTADPACSSLFPPDEESANLYQALEVIKPASRRPITVDTLDLWAEREQVTDVSFLKLDTQGSEGRGPRTRAPRRAPPASCQRSASTTSLRSACRQPACPGKRL